MEIQYGNIVVRINEREEMNPTILEKCFIQSVERIVFERHKKQVEESKRFYKEHIKGQDDTIKELCNLLRTYEDKAKNKKRFFIF